MEIVVGKYSGFCNGVSNAVETAKKVYGENVYILGELIHNEHVVSEILSLGSKMVDEINQIPNGATVIIRSHGATKKVFESLQSKNCKIIDCTCGFVKKIHKIVEEKSNQGYQIVILGEPCHAEVVGIAGWCNGEAIVVSEFDPSLDFSQFEKLCIVAQTTYSVEKYNYFFNNFNKNQCKIVEFFETICYTTNRRQNEAEELSKKCDAIVVIGGVKSSNTRKLFEICKKNCQNVFLVSKASEVDVKKLKNFYKLGIVAGASTPKEQSMEVFTNMAEEVKVVGEMSMDEAYAEMDKKNYKKGDRITATISLACDEGLMLYLIGAKTDILLSKSDMACESYSKEDYSSKVGDEIEVLVLETKPKLIVSQKAIVEKQKEDAEIEAIKAGKEFSAKITGFNKGGLTAKYLSYDVFVPSSQIRIGFVKDLEKYVGKTLRLIADSQKVESKGRRKQIVASQRVILEAEKAARDAAKKEKEDKFFASINVEDIVKGKVVRFASFGAFVEVDGFDCLAHISDLSWVAVKDPAEVLELNKEYEFVVLKIDREKSKVSIGYKQLMKKPWDLAMEKFNVDDVVTGKIVRIVPFGVFVELAPGVDGLVHISQISHEWLENPTEGLTVGQEVEAKIIGIDYDKEKITLSIKATKPVPEKADKKVSEKKDNGEEKPKRKASSKKQQESDEIVEWKDDDFGTASIADLINKKN